MPTIFNTNPLKASLKRSKTGVLLLAIALTGCNSADTEAKQNDAGSNNTESKTLTTPTQTTVEAESDPEVVAALEANFKASGFEQKIISATPTQMDNIYWVTGEGIPAFYSDKQGRHIIQGQIIKIGQPHPIDISADLVANTAKEKLSAVAKEDMVIYPAKGETKAVVYAFTDADCPYCTKLHSEMDQINDLGIEVRYLAWPRSERSIPKMESIWCSRDRNVAMDKAKSGQPVPASACDSPVLSQIQLGMSLGVSGTPAIYTESGHQIGGYLPAHELAQAAIANF